MFGLTKLWAVDNTFSPTKELISINGKRFPRNSRGFIRFDYSKTFKDVAWNETQSFWQELDNDKVLVRWDAGIVGSVKGPQNLGFSVRTDLHKRWRKLGYMPGFWRVGEVWIDENQPFGMDISKDIWPTPIIAIPEENYRYVCCGKVRVHEFCHANPRRTEFQTDFKVVPVPETKCGRYLPLYQHIEFMREEEWTIS